MQARLDTIRNDSRPIAKGGWGRGTREAQGEQQPHAVGSSEIEILADHGCEEVAALHRTIEDLGQTDFELADGEAVVVPGRAFLGGHRPRQAMRPAVEEGLDVGRPERIAGSLQGGGVGARKEPIVEALEANAIAAEALLHPLMAVETELHRIREIGADLEKGGPPVTVLDVEVVMIDGHRLPREVKDGCVATALAFVRFERSHLLLGHVQR